MISDSFIQLMCAFNAADAHYLFFLLYT